MTLYAPLYYQKFSCIADKCRHSCCIGWEIDVDPMTLAKYESLKNEYSAQILQSIAREEVPHFRLCAGERCPHLDDRGLCRIITSCGEGYLCDICREHPRFYNNTVYGREVGIGMSCEEACRLILSETDFFTVAEVGKRKGRPCRGTFNALPHRARIFDVLRKADLSYTEKLASIREDYDISLSSEDDGEYRELLSSLEYMYEENRARFSCFSAEEKTPKEMEDRLLRALAYFVYRHVTAASSEDGIRMAVGFSLFCERLLCSLVKSEGVDSFDGFCEIARVLSEEIEYSEENTETIKLAFF